MIAAQRIAIKQDQLGNRDRARALAQVRVILGRPVASRKDLGDAEVSVLMSELEDRRRAGLAAELAEAPAEYLVRRLLQLAREEPAALALVEEIAIRLYAANRGADVD